MNSETVSSNDYPEAILSYSVTPGVVPCTTDPNNPSIVTLNISVTNRTSEPVSCTQLVFTVSVGEYADDLTYNPESIICTVDQGTDWSVSGDGEGNFTAVPNFDPQLDPGASIGFSLGNVVVSSIAGLAPIIVLESTGTTRQYYIEVKKLVENLEP